MMLPRSNLGSSFSIWRLSLDIGFLPVTLYIMLFPKCFKTMQQITSITTETIEMMASNMRPRFFFKDW